MTLEPIAPHLSRLVSSGTSATGAGETVPRLARGRPATGIEPKSVGERVAKFRAKKKSMKLEHIAILDFETDPFDAEQNAIVAPFMAVLYSECFETQVFWNDDPDALCAQIVEAIEALPHEFTIYAHNGGKFDYLFLIHRLRGFVSFKGRGIMAAKIGAHELRDSLHILPMALKNYKKDTFDYTWMLKANRERYRAEIVSYCLADCVYLLQLVSAFIKKFGLKMSIGQAAMAGMKEHYHVKNIGAAMDADLREFFFGGRVECIMGLGRFDGPYKLFDVNSMYPRVMAFERHPISNEYIFRKGKPGAQTCFIKIECENDGALIGRGENGETTADIRHGIFNTTIHEYKAAKELGLIRKERIIMCVDNMALSSFDKFVLPRYEARQATKAQIEAMEQAGVFGGEVYDETVREDIFTKLVLNNAYGKFAQNPRRFREYYVTGPDERPDPASEMDRAGFPAPWDVFPEYECATYCIWSRAQAKQRFNNVGTAASITGAARAVLLRAMALAVDPIYCDTDSLICRDLPGVELSQTKLGAWKLEAEMSSVLIAGKKLYAARLKSGKEKIRSKGASGLTWKDVETLIAMEAVSTINRGPTLTRTGKQYYIRREIRATAPQVPSLFRGKSNGEKISIQGRVAGN